MDRSALARHLISVSQLQQQLERELLPTGIADFDSSLGGLIRGGITEVYGPSGSGKTSFTYALLHSATANGEYCAYVDASDAFDPFSASKAGTNLTNLLWVRCSTAEQALRSADLLVHSGGWGMVVMDFADVRSSVMQRLPVSYWYRFRRAVENTPTVLVILERESYVRNCAAMTIELPRAGMQWSGAHPDFRILRGAAIEVFPRKPVGKKKIIFPADAVRKP